MTNDHLTAKDYKQLAPAPIRQNEIFASVLRSLASPPLDRVELAECDAARPSRCFSEPKERYIEALCASDAVTLLAETVAADCT